MYRTALVLIARNEAHCIERCLNSLRPWVDQMIVLDTGSEDDTPARAAAAGAEVHHFQWVDDFSAARNAALAHSQADWNIVVDADEWLDSGGEALAGLRQQHPDFVGALFVNSSFDTSTSGESAHAGSWISRVLPRGIQYEGLIHEQPHHALPVHRLPVTLGHDGYERAAMDHKGNRNALILQRALQSEPDNAYLLYQAGKDHEVHDRFEAAHAAYVQAWARCDPDAPWRHDLLIRHLFVMKQVGALADALALAEQEMPHWMHSADFFFTLGDLLLSQAVAAPSEASVILPVIESSWQRCLELGDTLDLEGSVAGRGSHLAAHNLMVFHESLGQAEPAAYYRDLAEHLKSTNVASSHSGGRR